jgi:hypothetical protein
MRIKMRIKMMRVVPALVLSLGLLVPNSAHATPVIVGGVESALALSYVAGFMQGYDFVSTANQSLTALGFWDEGADGLSTSFQVGLWATATQTLLASVTISSADALDLSLDVAGGSWRYETLGAAIALTAGTTYTLGWQVGPGGLSSTDSLFIDYPTLTTAPTVFIANESRFLNTGGAFAFPTNVSAPVLGEFRANVNAQIGPTAVPEPASLALSGLGLLCLCARRLRQSRKA